MFEVLPSCKIAVPTVPAVLETVKGSANCQHCSTDAPFAAEIAVRLKNVDIAVVTVNSRKMQRINRSDMLTTIINRERLG